MNVKLISTTTPSIEGVSSAEELIVYTARVSNPENQLNMDTAERLLAYLVKHNHWSPFEMVDMTVEITTSRGIAQQILRHRSFSFQEFSQRYSQATQVEPMQLRMAGATNRQSSLDEFDPVIFSILDDDDLASNLVEKHFVNSIRLYNELISAGVAKECARGVLPISTQTTLYMKGSIRSWIHYLKIRTDEATQLEHRNVADAILDIFKSQFPTIHKSLNI